MSDVERMLGVGNGYVRESKYIEALPWLTGAVALAENGDMSGHVDSEILSTCLEAVGFCYFRMDKLAAALRWYKRAIVQAGDGVDLGTRLDMVASCYSRLGEYAEALPWFERAVTVRENANVEPAELGRYLHDVGDCYVKLSRYAEALPWLERAVAAKEQGDAHGHIDTKSLALSLRQVADCIARAREPKIDTRPWPSTELARSDTAEPLAWRDAVSATFPVEWRQILREQVPFYRGLRGPELERFEDKLKMFVYTKTFSAKQMAVTEEMKVVVAAAACRLTMNLPWENYDRLRYVSVHAKELEHDGEVRVIGRGGCTKVTVSWVDLVEGFSDPDDGNHVGYHEFAHALDGADGSMDGEAQGPPNDVYQVWSQVMTSARAEVRRALTASVDPPINAYAAESDAEFFAVATEWFFERPRDLRAKLPAVYDVLRRFYLQDPLASDAPG